MRFGDKIVFLNRDKNSNPLPIKKAVTPQIIAEYYNIDIDNIEYNREFSFLNIRF
jgi:ABC-type cobalamin/Fe3+-siderophores transport system ATPase subunit